MEQAKKIERSLSKLSVSEIYEAHQLDKYVYDNSVEWSDLEKGKFIDRIIQNQSVLPFYVYRYYDRNDNMKTKIQILKGQNKIKSIIEFIQGKITSANGITYEEARNTEFWHYTIPYEMISSNDPDDVQFMLGNMM